MPLLTGITLPNDGETADAADVNDVFNAIIALINGNLDSDNLAANSVGTSELQDGSVTVAKLASATKGGWYTGLNAPNTITYNGNRSYTLTFNSVDYSSVISTGMRLRTTRSSVAPNQCTQLNGSTQYWVKTSPNKMTWTDDFSVGTWIKLLSYPTSGNVGVICGRYDGTSGWGLYIQDTGRPTLQGLNAGAANFSYVQSVQPLPLNKWIHVAAQLDMSAFNASATESYVMFDGYDQQAVVGSGGTNPTALVQAGNFEVGAWNSGAAGSFCNARIAQVAVFSAKVTQSTWQGYISQGLSGSETNIASAYSFSNSTNDLNTTTPNNLSAGAGAPTATTADSPFGGQADGTISTTLDYAVVGTVAYSTNTTVSVMVPEGNTIPTSGGVTAVAYSPLQNPYGFRGSLTFPYSGNRSTYNVSVPSLTNSDQDLSSSGLAQTVYSPIPYVVMVTVSLGISSTTDYEFRPEIRVDGTTSYKMSPVAALGSAGGRAHVRSFTYAIQLTAGAHKISAGVELSAATTPTMPVTGGTLAISYNPELVY